MACCEVWKEVRGGEGKVSETRPSPTHPSSDVNHEAVRQQRRQRDGRQRSWLARLVIVAFCFATPSAGLMSSGGLFTQCFGLERIPRTVSSCSLVLHKGTTSHSDDDFTFFTHDGRMISLPADSQPKDTLSRPGTFAFHTYDGRTIPVAESSTAHWRSQGLGHTTLTDDLAVSILRSRYPGSTHQYAKSRVEARPFLSAPSYSSPFYPVWLPSSGWDAASVQERATAAEHRPEDVLELPNAAALEDRRDIDTIPCVVDVMVHKVRHRFETIQLHDEGLSFLMGQLAFLGHMSAVAEHGSLMLASLPKGADEGPFSSRITLRLRGGSTYRTPQADLSCAINSTGLKSKGDPTGVAENDKTAGLDSAGAGSWQGAVETAPPNLGAVPETQARRLLSQRMEAPTHGVTPTVPIGGARNLMRVSSRALDGGKPLRIALLTWESLHTIAVGGVAPHVTELAAGLERRGHEVHVYSRTGDGQMPYEIIDGVHIHRVPIALDPDFITECGNMCNSFCWFLSESESFQGAKFDICHGHDWLAAKALVQCKNMGRNTVTTIHSTEYGRCGNVNYGGQSERIRRIEEEAVAAADRVISVSGVLCDEVKLQFDISEDKLRMVYNGIHIGPYLSTVDAGSVKARYDMGPLDPLVLFVGRLATQKGPDLLVEAVPMVLSSRSDVKFAIVGDGYMRADLERRVHELGVSASVRFLGPMSGLPLVQLFKSADCVCIPSRNEPFGIVVLEAWASGKPVVATSSGGPREFVDHGVDGFHVHPSANSISWGICELFASFENARQMGLRGRLKAQNRFNWDKIAEDTERIYRELAGF